MQLVFAENVLGDLFMNSVFFMHCPDDLRWRTGHPLRRQLYFVENRGHDKTVSREEVTEWM